ncbi:hypothetical protein PSH54_15030 [Pseudoalteromonas sp. Angola-30]|uniref:hypothetical protein n=1 Tax=Pseudoalteromonas sp. Angola-30 TaxID=3025341 RepID=UPI002358BF68|nr:hypothetical protein [Pseudoalteromonas sp. Angola-30]MDC9526791.1 hypothetical protein [Pseudoalteromonas sp. Angola-30]
MKNTKSQFIRQYVRASKTPWDDCTTVLLLADIVDKKTMDLSFTNYVYLHRDSVGQTLGISISKQLLEANPEFTSRYLEGIEMVGFLLIYLEQIAEFCELFHEEFQSLFMLTPSSFFRVAESEWLAELNNV